MSLTQVNSKLLLVAVGLIAIFVTPTLSYDPTNIGRFLALSVFGLIFFAQILVNFNYLMISPLQNLFIFGMLFIVWGLVATLVSGINLTEGFFGVTGRQTGLISYICLVSIAIFSAVLSNQNQVQKILRILVYVSLISSLYGLIQFSGNDPFDWINPYSPVFGTLGNPNFHSSLMGICGAVSIALASYNKLVFRAKLGYLILASICLFNVFASKSQQGYLVFIIGILSFILLKSLSNNLSRGKIISVCILAFTSLLAIALDILQKAPWRSVLYKESVSFRGDFWRAGWAMTLDNPIFGVGFDGYRDQYRIYRDSVAASRPDNENYVDSAHNVFLDLSASAGFPLLILYILIIMLVLSSILRLMKSQRLNTQVIAMISGWFAYLAQSLISINHLGLAIWGWVFGGMIIGYEVNTREGRYKSFELSIGIRFPIAVTSGLILGMVLGVSQTVADATFRYTMKNGDVTKIVSQTQNWPKSVTRMVIVASVLRGANLNEQAAQVAQAAVEFNPENYEAWKELSLQSAIPETLRNEASRKVRELNPLGSPLP